MAMLASKLGNPAAWSLLAILLGSVPAQAGQGKGRFQVMVEVVVCDPATGACTSTAEDGAAPPPPTPVLTETYIDPQTGQRRLYLIY